MQETSSSLKSVDRKSKLPSTSSSSTASVSHEGISGGPGSLYHQQRKQERSGFVISVHQCLVKCAPCFIHLTFNASFSWRICRSSAFNSVSTPLMSCSVESRSSSRELILIDKALLWDLLKVLSLSLGVSSGPWLNEGSSMAVPCASPSPAPGVTFAFFRRMSGVL